MIKWIYRYPSLYNFMDSAFSLSMADRVRKRAFASMKPSSLLEIGIGSGKNMKLLASPVRVGVDRSLHMLEYTRTKFRGVGLIAGDAMSLPLKDGSFDMSVFCYVLRGLKSPVEAVKEGLRVSSRVLIIDYDCPRLLPRIVWDRVISPLGRAVYGSRDLDYAAIENLGTSKDVVTYYGGLYRVIVLDA